MTSLMQNFPISFNHISDYANSGIASLTLHPGFNIGLEYDIALLELKEEDELDLTVYTPACLARSDDRDSFDNKIATVAGWGFSSYINSTNSTTGLPMLPDPFEPQEVDLTVRPVSVCPGLYGNGTEKSPSEICAGLDTGGKDACEESYMRRRLI